MAGLCAWMALGASAQPAPPERVVAPGEGVLCAWGIYTAMASVGATCFPGENPEFQADLRRFSEDLEAYVARNDKRATPQSIAEFKRVQGKTETPAAKLCHAEIIQLYRSFEGADRKALRASVAAAVARSGQPTWGTCL